MVEVVEVLLAIAAAALEAAEAEEEALSVVVAAVAVEPPAPPMPPSPLPPLPGPLRPPPSPLPLFQGGLVAAEAVAALAGVARVWSMAAADPLEREATLVLSSVQEGALACGCSTTYRALSKA